MTLSHRWSALRHPSFACFLTARFCATLAVQMQSVAVGWQVYELTGDPLDLGWVGLAQFLPFFLMILPAGQMADRLNRRRILFFCYAAEVLCGLSLFALTVEGNDRVLPIFAAMALYGSARAFMMPASQAMTPNLVPPERLGHAVALSSSAFQFAQIAGPAVGGVLYLAGASVTYFAVAVLLTVAMLATALIDSNAVRSGSAAANRGRLLDGLRFVKARPIVLGAISLDLFAVLFGGATALLPAYAKDILQVGPAELGLLRTAPGLGAALTAVALAVAPIDRRVGRRLFEGVILFGLATVLLALSDRLILSLSALFMLGAGDMVSVYIRQMLVQLETPDAIRGRVSAVNSVFIGASNELGEFESGLVAAWLGIVPTMLLGGVATLLIALLWMRLFPSLRTIDRLPKPAA